MAISISGKLPAYQLHSASGLARCRINGHDHYLGPWGSEESRIAYGKLIAEHLCAVPTGDEIDPFAPDGNGGISIAELAAGYLEFAKLYYRKGGEITDEVGCIKSALSPLVTLYGYTPAGEFGPKRLKVVRQMMIDDGNKCRRFINQSCGRLRRAFRWATENELVDVSVVTALETVAPLKAGRCEAKDHAPRKPVPQANIDAVKGEVKERTADIMTLMLLCGARPGEIVKLTGAMIDRSGDVWTANIEDHKTAHRGKVRVLVFGQKCQEILLRYMSADPSQRLFRISRAGVSAAIKAACAKLGIPKYTGHWLRHNSLTAVRKQFGLDASQAIAGHSNADVTQTYAALDMEKALEVARKVG